MIQLQLFIFKQRKMSSRQSLKLVIQTINNQQCQQKHVNRPSGLKRNSLLDDYHQMVEILPPPRRTCWRCRKQQALLQCIQCGQVQFCSDCSNGLHKIGKFINHHQNLLPPYIFSQNMLNPNNIITDRRKVSQNNQKLSQIKNATISITQSWNKIISQLQIKFKEVIDSLQDKKNQILFKIQLKKEQEIKSYIQLLKKNTKPFQFQSGRTTKQKTLKKYITEKSEFFDSKMKTLTLQNETVEKKSDLQYKLALSTFQQIQQCVSKLDIKSLLLKVVDQSVPQTSKKPMKSSLIVGTSTSSYALSPFTRTPTNKKSELSLSTIQGDYKQKSQKPNKQQVNEKMNLYYTRQTKMLNKVRSEKLFGKSPTSFNLQKVAREKVANKKKQNKVEQ